MSVDSAVSNSQPPKTPFLFFFSYARADSEDTDRLIRFFFDLRKEVRARTGLSIDEIAFRDITNIETGDNWSDEMTDALQTSRVLVSLISPTYIGSDFCGKEFQVFLDRLEHYTETHPNEDAPRAILPVIWIPPKTELPKVLSSRQLHDDDLPDEYKTEGLDYVIRLNTKNDQYQEFLKSFADKIVAAAGGPVLPQLNPAPHIDRVISAFHRAEVIKQELAEGVSGGPNDAKFVFVAAAKHEIEQVRKGTVGYHPKGGWFWQPFLPTENNTIGRIAQDVASAENLRFIDLSWSNQIVDLLKQADQMNEIIIIVVDAWSIKLDSYHKIMRLYDNHGFLNCGVLVPWNENDDETKENKQSLDDRLTITFTTAVKHPIYFNDSIWSADQLRTGLRATLNAIKLKIIQIGEAKKRIEGEAKPKPDIPVPAGDAVS